MIQLRTLGTLDLRSPEHDELRQVLAQPKRFALLVYLAVAPGPFQRRDTLFALFWPESDAERARGSLRTALHFLRRALGAGVVAGRGTEEVGLAEGALWCDARAFEAELAAGRAEAALELYRGPFLAGFNLAGVAEWERWVADERERLRRLAVDAAESLARDAEAGGDTRGVLRWARRAAALDPDDEGALRRMMERLARAGDGAAAIQAYEELARRLRAEYDAEPSRATRALADEIRRGAADPEPTAPRAPRVEPEVVLPPTPSPPAPPVVAERTGRVAGGGRRRGWLGAAAALLVLVAAAWWARSGTAGADRGPARVAVLPFAVYGTREVAYLREGMVDLLASKLDGAGDLRSVDPRALLAAVGPAEPATAEAAADAAERLEAELFVLGSVTEAGPQVQLRATLYRADGPHPQSDAAVQGPRDSLPRLVDRLTAQLLAGRLNGPGARLQRTAVLATPSVPALKAYLQGESALRRGHYDDAKAALQRAVDEDSTFALAWYRLSVAIAGSGRRTGEAPRQAVRLAGRLDPYDRLLLQAWLASWDFRYADAERMYRQAVATRPDDVEAWTQLAQVLFHGGPPRGRPAAESRPAWQRVRALEPDNVEALGYLARIALAEGRLADADTLLARALALNPDGDRAVVWLGYRGVALGDRAAMDSAVAGVRRASDLGAWVIAWRMVEDTRAPAAARPLVEPLLDPARPARVRASGHVVLAHTEVARGRWIAARAHLDSAASLDPAVARQARTLFAVLPFVPVHAGDVARVRAELRAAAGGIADAPPGVEPAEAPPVSGALRLHALGLLEARAGNPVAALGYARGLDSLPGERIRGPLLADGVRAHVSWLGGRPADGLAVLDSAWQEHDRKPEVYPYLLDPGHPRFLRAELLRLAGRDAEALRWYGSVTEHFDKSIVYVAPVHLRSAEILERLGRRREAAAHLARFVELWRDSDPALRPMVERARRRLQRLQP
jgi:serine/threonine-protein kinase